MKRHTSNWLVLLTVAASLIGFDSGASAQGRPSGGGGRPSGGGGHARPSSGGGGASARPAPSHSSAPSRPSSAPASRPVQSAPSRPVQSAPAPRSIPQSRPVAAPSAPTSRPVYVPDRSRGASSVGTGTGRVNVANPSRTSAEPSAPVQRAPVVRYDDSSRFQPSPAASGSSIDYERGPASRESGDASASSTERVWQPSRVIDLGNASRPTRTPVPRMAGSIDRGRVGPASGRTSSLVGRDSSRAPAADDARALGAARARIREQGADRTAVLDRYRDSGRTAIDGGAASTRTLKPNELGPSARRGVIEPSTGAIARDRANPRTPASPGSGRVAPNPSASSRANRERQSLDRLDDLATKDPKSARSVILQGEALSVATHTGVQIGIGMTLAGSGISGGSTFWDPCHSPSACSPWVGWCSPSSWWWWGCAYPYWGFGACYGGFSFWWGWPSYYAYPYGSYYCPPPAYYSYVVYDTVDPQPVYEEVVVQEAAPAGAVGEGTLETKTTPVPAPGDSATSDAMARAAGHYLTLGDRAFRDGRYSDAVHFYAKAIEYSPNDGVLHLILSDALFATGDYHYAAYALRRAFELDARLVESTVDKHTFYSNPNEFDTQLMLLERYVQDHFVDDDARLLLAANYLFGGRADAAIEILESPFSVDVKESSTGRLLLERSRTVAQSAPAQKR